MSAPTPLTPFEGFFVYPSESAGFAPMRYNAVWITDNDGDTNSVIVANFETGECFHIEGNFSKSQARMVATCFHEVLSEQVG